MVQIYTYVRRFDFLYKSSSAAVRIDQWYKYITMSGVSTSNINISAAVHTDQWCKYIPTSSVLTSNINHHQLQYTLRIRNA